MFVSVQSSCSRRLGTVIMVGVENSKDAPILKSLPHYMTWCEELALWAEFVDLEHKKRAPYVITVGLHLVPECQERAR